MRYAKHERVFSRALVPALLAAVWMVSGCTSPSMRSSPYYAAELVTKATGKPEDRIPLWPVVYYNEPIFSLMWPFVVMTDDYFAFRPVVSVHHPDKGKRDVSVLWPIARFQEDGDNRIFPLFYWGKNHAVVFPLYWHLGQPFGPRGGSDTLFPLWSFARDRRGMSIHAAWPVLHWKNRGDEKGWRVWPVAGHYGDRQGSYNFALWPLAHQWASRDGREAGSTVAPLYYYSRDSSGHRLLTLPFSYGRGADGSAWECTPPLYYRERDANGSVLLTPLFWAGSDRAAKSSWHALVPLYYASRVGDRRLFATALGGCRTGGGRTSWMALPLLSGGHAERGSGSVWMAGPLARYAWRPDGASHHLFPLYCYDGRPEGTLFLSLPWSQGTRDDGTSWRLLPPLFFEKGGKDGLTLLTPVGGYGSSRSRQSLWHTTLPLYYYGRKGKEATFATLLGGTRRDAEGRSWMIWPLLSGGSRGEGTGNLWFLAPFFHVRWDKDSISHHVAPLYYWDGKDRTLVSLLAARWKGEDGQSTTLVPPLLSLLNADKHASRLWMLGGLARASWGRDAGPQYLLPVFYANRDTGTFASPAFARWRWADDRVGYMVPPALSWLTVGEKRKDLWVAGPVGHFSWGEKGGGQHLLPLFYANYRTKALMTPLIGTWKDDEGVRKWLFPPLLAGYTHDRDQTDVFALLGLFWNSWGKDRDDKHGHLIPLYYYGNGCRTVLTPVFGWRKGENSGYVYPLTPLVGIRFGNEKGAWLFPLFSHTQYDWGDYEGWFLWGRYTKDAGRFVRCSMFPLFAYSSSGPVGGGRAADWRTGTYGREFMCLPAIWYENTLKIGPDPVLSARAGSNVVSRARTLSHGFFPLWNYEGRQVRRGDGESVNERLFCLPVVWYRSNRDVQPASAGDGKTGAAATAPAFTTGRSHGFWPLWAYSSRRTASPKDAVQRAFPVALYDHRRVNDQVSVDVFPAVTYDRRGDDFRKISWLWRLFRYESGPAGKKVDVLFMPVYRGDPQNIRPLSESAGKAGGESTDPLPPASSL